MKIAKNHDAIKKIKDTLKTNSYPNLSTTDDIQILKIINDFNVGIDTLVYSYEDEFKEDTQCLLNSLISKSKNVYEISKSTYQSIATKENHAGIMAIIELPKYNLEDLKSKEFLFVLDRLEIPGNIGTIYRTLDSVKADGVILVDSISKLHNPKLLSAARGCNLTIPSVDTSYDEAIKWLIENNYTIFLGEPKLGLDYQSYDYKGKIAIVVGNERFGINSDWYNHNHKKVFIPMEGNQNSLNVGVAASILAYEAYMKKKV
ncbi:MAG: RNA methyltransferase [Erysipelotrichaceae bacterium]|nr:RNA methyltransferase [Erysipelotrichaceae bacterium]